MKKLYLFIIALVTITAQSWAYDFSAVAPSGQTIYYKIVNGNAQVEGGDNLSGSLVIPSSVTNEGTTYSVTAIRSMAFYFCTDLTSVTLPNTVTSIGQEAFDGCSGLTSITLSSTLTSIKHYSFAYCSSLTSITIPASVTSINSDAFQYCSGLESIIIEEGNSVYDSRDNCNAIITTDNNTLYIGCKNTVIPNTVTSIGECAFYGCTSLSSITIPPSVTSIGNEAFSGCTGFSSVTISNSVVTIGNYAFSGCTSLTSVTIPNSVTTIGNYAFVNCSGLTSVTLPNAITSIGNFTFNGCSSLTSITIPNSVTTIGNSVFSWCSSLTSVYYTGDIAGWCGINFTADGSNPLENAHNLYINNALVTELVIPDNVTEIKQYAFSGATCLTSVSIGNTVSQIQRFAFYECSGITSLAIGNSVTTIAENAFSYCSGISGILTIPNSVTSIGGGAFSNCSGINGVQIPNSVTSMGGYAFHNCSGITGTLTIPDILNTIGVSAFDGCSGITSVIIGNSVSSIDDYAFYNCTNVQTITIPITVTSIGESAFFNCGSITRVYYTGDIASWCGISFSNPYSNPLYYGHKLYINNILATDIVIPNNVTEVKKYAFCGARHITSVSFPASILSIGDYALQGCDGLTEIHSLNTVPPTASSNTFLNVPTTIPVYIPCGYLSNYTSAGGWSRFTNFIESEGSTFSAVSDDEIMGTVQILTMPTCSDPQAEILASANSGYRFDHWSDGNTANPYSLTITEDTELIGYFVPEGGSNGIDDVETAGNLKIYTRGNSIVIDFSGQQAAVSRQDIVVYDVMGRVIKQAADSGQQAAIEIPVTSAGVYMVKVGDRPSRKVLVRS